MRSVITEWNGTLHWNERMSISIQPERSKENLNGRERWKWCICVKAFTLMSRSIRKSSTTNYGNAHYKIHPFNFIMRFFFFFQIWIPCSTLFVQRIIIFGPLKKRTWRHVQEMEWEKKMVNKQTTTVKINLFCQHNQPFAFQHHNFIHFCDDTKQIEFD